MWLGDFLNKIGLLATKTENQELMEQTMAILNDWNFPSSMSQIVKCISLGTFFGSFSASGSKPSLI